MSGMSEMQSHGANVWMMEDVQTGGESVLMTRLESDKARMSWSTARTTRPVLNMMTMGREPPAAGSMNLRESRVMTRMMQTELFSLSRELSAGWVQNVANSREAAHNSGNTATFLSRVDLLSITRLTSMSM